MKRLFLLILLSLAFVQPTGAEAVDLISLVDLNQDVVNGNWQLVNGELIMEGGAVSALLSFPYYPPVEYDYTVEFSITFGSDPWDNIAQLVSHGDVPFTFSTNAGTGHYCRLEDINGHSVIGNPTLIYYPFVDEQRYTSIVRVRNDRVICEINGDTLIEYETDYSDLSRNPQWVMPDQLKIGLGGWNGPITFHSATVTPPEPLDDTMPPTGAVHAYPNVVKKGTGKDKTVSFTLEGYICDEMSIARDGGGCGVSSAFLMIGGLSVPITLDDEDCSFSITIQIQPQKGDVYPVQLYGTDTEPAETGGPNMDLVDETTITVSR